MRILKANGVTIWAALLVDPDWTADEFDALYDYFEADGDHLHAVYHPHAVSGHPAYREKYDQLLTHDYTCFDAMHAVVPTRLPREEFYRRYARIYRELEIRPYFDLVQAGKTQETGSEEVSQPGPGHELPGSSTREEGRSGL